MNGETRFREFLEEGPDAFFVHDLEGRFTDVNRQACRTLGYTREELLEMTVADIVQDFDLAAARDLWVRSQPGDQISLHAYHRRKDGTAFPVEAHISICLIDETKAVFTLVHDVTENRRTEERKERLTRLYRALSEVNQAIVRMDDEARLFPLVCRIAVELGGMKMAWVGQAIPESGLIKPIVSFGTGVGYLDGIAISTSDRVREGQGPTAVAFRESRSVIVDDFRASDITAPWHDRAADYGWGSSGSFAVTRSGGPFAVLNFYHERQYAFDSEMADLLNEMARDISFALDNFDRERERKKLMNLLQESEERLRLTLDATQIGVWDWDLKNDRWNANAIYFQMLGYDPDSADQNRGVWSERAHPNDLDFVTRKMATVRDGDQKEFDIDFRLRHADGSYRWINSIGRAIEFDENGKARRMLGLRIDITQRRQAEETLRKSEEIFSKTFRNCPNPISITTLADGKYIEVNDAWIRLTGYSRQEIAGKTSVELGIWKNPADRIAFVAELTEKRRVLDLEVALKTKSAQLTCLISAEIVDIDNEPSVVIVAQEITDLRRAMETIKEQRNFLEAVLESEPECVKVVTSGGKLIQMNKAGLAMLETDSLEEAQNIGLLEFILPGYREDFVEFHKYICAGNSGVLEFPILGKRGTQRWLETHATPLRNVNGDVIALLGVTRDVTEKKRSDELIWRQANYDSLTDLPNRYMFFDRLEQEVKKAHRDGESLAVLFIDLDRFKEVNDSMGHQSGDALLVEAAQRIGSCVREADTVARLGGDEFMVILSQLHDIAHVETIAQNIITSLAKPFSVVGQQPSVYISASIGITLYPSDAVKVDELLSNADQAMYVAKNTGRNRFSYFTRALQERVQTKIGLINDLHGALAGNQFLLFFQPIVELATNRVIKVEALLRWQHPKRGIVGPMEFIPLAEETRLVSEIGDWVFREASRWASRWASLCPAGIQVSVNMSPVQFLGDELDIDSWTDYLRELNISGRNMAIEITESVLLHADSDVREKLIRFRDAGIQVAIDDFGTGYSALSYLKKFDIDYLKIDQSFVRDLATDPSDKALSEAVVVMAHKLGLKVIAEGVETAEQRDILAAVGCDFAQGYLFSEPVPPEVFEALLAKSGGTVIPNQNVSL